MAQYSVGTVKVVNASSVIRADSLDPNVPNYIINVAVDDLFKKRYEPSWYQVTSIVNATTFTISPAYAGISGTGLDYIIARDFTPNLNLPEQSSGDYDAADTYNRAIRTIDGYLTASVTSWIQDTSPPTRISATAFYSDGNNTTTYIHGRFVKVRGNTAAASANNYSAVATNSTYNATLGKTYVPLERITITATPTRYYYAANHTGLLEHEIKESHIDWGIGTNQVSASNIPINDSGALITANTVEGALKELKTNVMAYGNITATVTRNWVVTASKCTRASDDVFTASGDRRSLFTINTPIKITATVNASYYSYVATTPTYNATTVTTRVTLGSETVPATPIRFYTDTGNTATTFKLTYIAAYPDDFFNTNYYISVTTGSCLGNVRQVTDWTATSRVVTLSAKLDYTPAYEDTISFIRNTMSTTRSIAIQMVEGSEDAKITSVAYFVIPSSMDGMSLTRAQARVVASGSGTGNYGIQLRNLTKYTATDVLATRIVVAAGETLGVAGTVNTAYDNVSTDDLLKVYVASVLSTPAKGLIAVLEYS